MRKWNLALLIVLLTPTALLAQVKIAILDIDTAMAQSARGQAALQELTAYQAELQADIEETENTLAGVQQRIQTQQRVLSDERLSELQLQSERLTRELNRKVEDANLDMEVKRAELFNPLANELVDIVEEYVEAEGITLVLPPDAVVYAAEGTNITGAIVELYNERQASSTPPAPAPEAPAAPATEGGTGQ